MNTSAPMYRKTLHVGLILSSFIGYLEWGTDQSMFLIQGEWEIVLKLFSDPSSTLHPFIWLPLIGQITLIIAGFRSSPSPVLTWLGIAGIGLLLVFMFIIGFLGGGWLTTVSTVPFLVLAVLAIRQVRAEARG